MSTITEYDIMIDGMTEVVFPYLETLIKDYQISPREFRKFGIQLMTEDYSINAHVAETLYDAWTEQRKR